MRILIKLLILALLIPLIYKFCEAKTDGFRISRLSLAKSENPEKVPEGVDAILNQKFYYLASGGQSWVFLSEDQQYVLKFFKSYLRDRKGKLQKDLQSCKLAYDELKEETGLIYLHLNKTEDLKLKTTLVDKLHIEHPLDLDKTQFLVQKKAVLLYDHLRELMDKGDSEEAKEALNEICKLVIKRCEKGIFDEDPRLHCNLGFIGAKAILIDTGRFHHDDKRKNPTIYRKDLRKSTLKLKSWLETHYPELAPHLEQEVSR